MTNPSSSLIAFALACLELAGTSLAERVGAIPSGPDYDLAIPRQSDPSEALVTALIAEAKPCQIRPCTEVCRTETKRRRGSAVAYEVTTCAPEQSCIEDNAKCAKSISDQQKAATRDLVNRALGRVVTSPSPLAIRRKMQSPGGASASCGDTKSMDWCMRKKHGCTKNKNIRSKCRKTCGLCTAVAVTPPSANPGEYRAEYMGKNSCPAGRLHVNTEEECKVAAKALNGNLLPLSFVGLSVAGSGQIPKGCHLRSIFGSNVFLFNPDDAGASRADSSPVCKVAGISTHAPATPAPTTPAPTTLAPVTRAPVTSVPTPVWMHVDGEKSCYLAYCNDYTDLKNAFCGGNNCTSDSQYSSCKDHWNNNGRAEGRSPNPEVCTSEGAPVTRAPATSARVSTPTLVTPNEPTPVDGTIQDLTKGCGSAAFEEVAYTPNWWNKSICNCTGIEHDDIAWALCQACRNASRTFQAPQNQSTEWCANKIMEIPESFKLGKTSVVMSRYSWDRHTTWTDTIFSFVWSPSKKTCKSNPYDEASVGDEIYCVRRPSVKFMSLEVVNSLNRMRRPTWFTLQRCSSMGCVPCDKKEEGCFYGLKSTHERGHLTPTYGVDVAAGTDLHKSAITVTLKCLGGEPIILAAQVTKINNGDVTIFFNGDRKFHYSDDGLRNEDKSCFDWCKVEAHMEQGKKACALCGTGYCCPKGSTNGCDGNVGLLRLGRLPPTQTLRKDYVCVRAPGAVQKPSYYLPDPGLPGIDGDNEIMVVFTRHNMSAPASMTLHDLNVESVRTDFATCEDNKACLGKTGLGLNWESQQANKDLREFISLQYLCLNDEARLETHPKYSGHAKACREWADCLTRSGRLEAIKETVEALGGSTAPLPRDPELNAVSPTNTTPTACRNPYLNDPESWECACHETMVEKCKIKDCGKDKDCFASCYRTQLCNDKKVCPEWKRKVCTEIKDCEQSNNDDALDSALKKMSELNGAPQMMSKRHTCKDLASNCRHEEIGVLVRHHCPSTCGMCHLYPYTSPTETQANLELDDAVAGKATAQGWTLTPRSTMTHTPTDDQGCFVDPDAFDCNCYATKQRFCRNEDARKMHHLQHTGGKVYSASECEHFFVCTHSQTCHSYKNKHCAKEMGLLEKLQAQNRKIATC